MTTAAPDTDWNVAIALPLAVVADQLRRTDTQLRFLTMAATALVPGRGRHNVRGVIDGRLDQIAESLASIAESVADLQATLLRDAASAFDPAGSDDPPDRSDRRSGDRRWRSPAERDD